MKNSKVYSYLRFSDPRQATGSSADRQIQYATRWAAEHGLVLDDALTLRDEGLSAYHQRHVKQGALGAFLEAISAGRISAGSVLIVEGLDRLSRAEPILAQAQLAQIINAGITVVTASDGKEYNRELIKNNPMDLVYSLLIMIRAHEESDTKSKRIKAAVKRQAEAWIAGTFRGRIVNGRDPQWLDWDGEKWIPIPERVEAFKIAFRMYKDGYGAKPIFQHLFKLGLTMTNKGLPNHANFYRSIRNPALYGTRILEVGGEKFELKNYYPAIITEEEYNSLQTEAGGRFKFSQNGGIIGVVSGLGILRCGYCGAAAVVKNYLNRKKESNGNIKDSHRRLMCLGAITTGIHSCPMPATSSVAPVENAIMEYCSDQLNLLSLQNGEDQSLSIRAKLSDKKTELISIENKIQKITNTILESELNAPKFLIKKASELESLQELAKDQIEKLENELVLLSQNLIEPALAETWAGLTDGVKNLENESRISARKLISDTFEKIIVYTNSINPPARISKTRKFSTIDLVLIPKRGNSRTLRVNRLTGKWVTGEDLLSTHQTLQKS
ncbi:recombinase family protein [Chromobacterium vaccinii]|uniref:recombinase family protein n=1 Tax=Chromobacterium vaccinii TaxID=1108595 RepID=UPI0009E65689|nr:recombinase family protein [Chromobacterium vaccinii]